MTGRPSTYSEELALSICDRISAGSSLRSICEDGDMPARSTVFLWLAAHQSFSDHYTRACEARTAAWAEEIIEISDDGSNDIYKDDEGMGRTDHDVIARSRLRVDTRKWLMSRMAPRKYGDKLTTEIQGKDGGAVQIERIERVIVDAPKSFAPRAAEEINGSDEP